MTATTTKLQKRVAVLALCFPSFVVVWTPYAFQQSLPRRPASATVLLPQKEHRLFSSTATATAHQHVLTAQPPLPEILRTTSDLQNLMNDGDNGVIIRNGKVDINDDDDHTSLHITTLSNSRQTEESKPAPTQTQTKKIRWATVAALLLISQLIAKVWNVSSWLSSPLNTLSGEAASAAAGTSTGAATAAATTTTTSTTAAADPVIFSAVSASILRRQKGVLSQSLSLNNLVQTMTVTFMVFKVLTQAGPFVQTASVLCTDFLNWYTRVLTSAPLITKSITGATIGILGDTIAQYLESRIESKHEQERQQLDAFRTSKSSSDNKKSFQWLRQYDGRRGASVIGESLFISGPLLHVAYNILEHLIPTTAGGIGASIAAASHVLADNFFLDPIFVAVMFVTTGLAEGYTIREIIPQFRKDYPTTIKTSWAASIFLLPVGFVCFRFLPLNYRVLGVNFIDIAWDAMISFFIHRSRRGHNHQDEDQQLPAGATI